MSTTGTAQELSPERFRGLAHSLRLRMLLLLRADGPSTATILAKRIGESTGATSYHLRQLALHGFIEPDPRPQQGRERWWRATSLHHNVNEPLLAQDPELAGVVDAYVQELLSVQAMLLGEWFAQRHKWSDEWRAAAVTSSYILQLSLDDARTLIAELEQTIARYRGEESTPPTDATEVFVVQLNAFPRRRP